MQVDAPSPRAGATADRTVDLDRRNPSQKSSPTSELLVSRNDSSWRRTLRFPPNTSTPPDGISFWMKRRYTPQNNSDAIREKKGSARPVRCPMATSSLVGVKDAIEVGEQLDGFLQIGGHHREPIALGPLRCPPEWQRRRRSCARG